MRALLVSLALLALSPCVAVAQDPPAAPDPDEAARQRIEEALDRPLTVNLEALPLRDALELLQGLSGLNLVLDPDAPADLPVSAKVQGTARQALDALLEGHDLQLRVWSGALIIVPAGKALPAPPRPRPGAANERRLLQQQLTVNFADTPLEEVAGFLRDITGLTIEVDVPAAPDAPGVSLRLRQVTPAQVLTLATYLAGVSWRAEGDAARIVAPPCHACGEPRPRRQLRCAHCGLE